MQIIADTHTHTIASTHAFSTAQEMIKSASEKGLYAIALTDHGYNMPGAPKNGEWFFDCLGAIPAYMYGVRVLKGTRQVYAYTADTSEDALIALTRAPSISTSSSTAIAIIFYLLWNLFYLF